MKQSDATAKATEPAKERRRSEIGFPAYGLVDSITVAKTIHERGGGVVTPEQLSAFLGYKGTNNGAYITRVAAARQFQLIQGGGRSGQFSITPLAQRFLMPVYPEDARAALVDAFMNVELFKAVYEEFRGKELPPEFGLKNLLRSRFGIVRQDVAYRVLMDSAEQAGLFSTKGSRTQLIIPQVQRVPTPAPKPEGDEDLETQRGGGGGGGDSGGGPTVIAQTDDELKRAYIAKLIGMLGKSEQGDPELMTRIEKLLAISN